jgi:hypothetical protein
MERVNSYISRIPERAKSQITDVRTRHITDSRQSKRVWHRWSVVIPVTVVCRLFMRQHCGYVKWRVGLQDHRFEFLRSTERVSQRSKSGSAFRLETCYTRAIDRV